MMAKAFVSRQFLHFLLAGAIAATVNFFIGHTLAGRLPLYGDVVVGCLAGMVTAFVLFERAVFGQHVESRQKSAGVFVLVNFFGLLQTWVVFALLKDYIFHFFSYQLYPDELARALAIVVPMFSSFIGHKYFTFKQ